MTDPAQVCGGGGGLRRAECVPGDPIDPWQTAKDAVMCHQFGIIPDSPAIPADFFGPGSDRFDGQVCLEGVPLGPTAFGDFGDADTLIRRTGGPAGTGDPFDRCDLPSGSPSVVDVEIVALSLRSIDPITVTYGIGTACDGQVPVDACIELWCGDNPTSCEQWNVAVDSSVVVPTPGSITAFKTHCNGGTYNSELHVQPRFTFTKDGGGGTQVLDTGVEGIPHVVLAQNDNPPWTSDVADTLGLPSDICTDFHPGVEDLDPVVACDCNGNGIRDKCDIEGGDSQDCNANAIPDLCDLGSGSSLDCDGSTVPDECDIATGAAQDCNGNEVPDDCDVDSGNSVDVNGNGSPDECDTSAPARPLAEDDSRKNRYISINPDNSVTSVALRVGLSSMRRCSGNLQAACVGDGDCVSGTEPCAEHPHVGQILGWVGEPDGNAVARVVHTPVFRMWPETLIHIGDCEVVPVATYEIRATPDGVDLSDPIEVGTIQKPGGWHYGDVVGLGTGDDPPLPGFTPPNRTVNVTDVQAYILTAQGSTSPSAHTTWVDLHGLEPGTAPNYLLNVSDLQRIKFGFLGLPYTATPEQEDPGDCP